MHKNIRLFLSFLFVACFAALPLHAQSSGISVSGKVLDQNSRQPIPYATIAIVDSNTQNIITGTTTEEDGTFSLQTKVKDFYVEVSFIGFVKQSVKDFTIANGKVHLGDILLAENSQTLDEVVIQAEKSTTEFKLDKRVFNVGKDLSSTGASALEVLNNVPSVNVNIEGQISLRGSSGVQILINGKPSVIASEQGNALGTITAEMIEKIEVITNPSAKYDAEGTTGIINIILKKEEKKGINGSVTLNAGYPHNHSIGLSLNRRTEKFNLFSQIGAGYRELPRYNRNINTNLLENTAVYSDGTEYRNEQFYNLILGTDYHINERNVLTLSGSFALELEDQPSKTNLRFENAAGLATSEWYRTETTTATNPKYQYELQYKSDFKDHKEHALLFSALGSFFGKDQSSDFEDITLAGTENDNQQKTSTNFQEANYTFKLDYTKPFAKKITIETGAQYVLQDVSNDYEVQNFENNDWIQDPSFTNTFDYKQNVLGIYETTSYEGEKFGIKAGLRVENTDLKTLLLTTAQQNNQNYTNLFPSLHTSYKLTERFSLQAGFSRRIYRPRLWDLNPFFNIRNAYTIRTGNPELQPEFTNAYELAAIYILEKISLNFSLYQNNTTDVIERVTTVEGNVTTTKPLNIGTSKTTGIEFNTQYKIHKNFSLQGDINYNIFNRKGTLEGTSFDFDADKWTTKWTAKWKLPAQIDFELTGQYESRYKTLQGAQADQLYADLGLRKKMLKGKIVMNLGVRDLFASRIQVSETFQPTFYAYNRGFRGRFFTFGISYGFGKGEAMEFSGQRHYH
ncbi:MAG: outer membrane beta-barrel family protein [Chitinophagales bacterium]|nr:TonB-dependent receptor [Bacteroidota bacterium]MCB9044272.1 TonB-dependent receptor [Chitinophagales bacterium]